MLSARERALAVALALRRQQTAPPLSACKDPEALLREVEYLQSRIDFLQSEATHVEPLPAELLPSLTLRIDSAMLHWVEASSGEDTVAVISAGLQLLKCVMDPSEVTLWEEQSAVASDLSCHVLRAVILAGRAGKCEAPILAFGRQLCRVATLDGAEGAKQVDVFACSGWLCAAQTLLEMMAFEFGHSMLLTLALAVRWVAERARGGKCERTLPCVTRTLPRHPPCPPPPSLSAGTLSLAGLVLSAQPIFAAFQHALEEAPWPGAADGVHHQAEWYRQVCRARPCSRREGLLRGMAPCASVE